MHSQPTGQRLAGVETADLVPQPVNIIIYDKLTAKIDVKTNCRGKYTFNSVI
jgi:hypothetical protein